MTARLIKTATSWKIPHEIVQILFPAALPPRLPWLCRKHEGMIRKRLVRRLNQPMTARLIKTATSWKIPHEIVQILFPAALPPRLPWLCRKHEGMITLVKRCHMMCHVKNYQGGIKEEWTEDLNEEKMEQFVYILM